MIVGLVLIVLTVALAAFAVAFNGSTGSGQSITLFGQHVVDATNTQIFLGGIALGLLFCVGVWIVAVAGRRRRALRAEFRAARKERDVLAEQLNQRQEPETVVASDNTVPKHAVGGTTAG